MEGICYAVMYMFALSTILFAIIFGIPFCFLLARLFNNNKKKEFTPTRSVETCVSAAKYHNLRIFMQVSNNFFYFIKGLLRMPPWTWQEWLMLAFCGWISLNIGNLYIGYLGAARLGDMPPFLWQHLDPLTGIAWLEMLGKGDYLAPVLVLVAVLSFWIWFRYPCWTMALVLCLEGIFGGPYYWVFWKEPCLSIPICLLSIFSPWVFVTLLPILKKWICDT